MVVGTPLQEELVDKAMPDDILEYHSMIESIMYPMIQTRPDICFDVVILSRYNQNPDTKHQAAAKRVIRYLKGTMDHEITYGTVNGLEGYTDADWVSDQKTRSIPWSGYSNDSNRSRCHHVKVSIWLKLRQQRKRFD